MIRVRGFAAALPLLSALSLAACGDGEGTGISTPPPAPPDQHVLREVTFAEIVRESFGAQGTTPDGAALQAADGSTYRELGRLIGRLSSPDDQAMAVFVDYLPSSQAARPGGVYVAVVSLDHESQAVYGDPWVLTSSGESIVPVAGAGDVEPFRQDGDSAEGVTSISPALVLDLEGDGLEEMALLVRSRLRGVSFEHYAVYQRQEDASDWRRTSGQGAFSTPGLTALEYWSSIGAAVTIASRWDRKDRLVTVWPWLAREGAPVDPDVVLSLVPAGDPNKTRETQEALTVLRTFFEEAHQRLSQGFQVKQPWPGFINGFKATEAAHLISVSPPVFDEDGAATVDVLLDLTEHEGREPVVRRFLVEAEMVREGQEWHLSGVSASEKREP